MPTATRPKATATGIKCGHCSSWNHDVYHATVADVRACSQLTKHSVAQLLRPVSEPDPEPKPDLLDGTYTIERTDGSHRTFQIRLQEPEAEFCPGKIIISFLSGRDNERDYTGFGFVVGSQVRVWNRFRSAEHTQLRADLGQLMQDPEAALKEARCELCHRKLSRPDSIRRRRGSDCAKKP